MKQKEWERKQWAELFGLSCLFIAVFITTMFIMAHTNTEEATAIHKFTQLVDSKGWPKELNRLVIDWYDYTIQHDEELHQKLLDYESGKTTTFEDPIYEQKVEALLSYLTEVMPMEDVERFGLTDMTNTLFDIDLLFHPVSTEIIYGDIT